MNHTHGTLAGMTADPIREDVEAGVATVVYELAGTWVATFTAQVSQPWEGPETLTIRPLVDGTDDEIGKTIDALGAARGIGTEVLSLLPLADARMRLRRLRAVAIVPAEDVEALRSRLRGPEALATFADLYARLARETPTPLVAMSAASGVSHSALSQRASRARKAGYLTRPTDDDPGSLTPEGARCLALVRAVHTEWSKRAHQPKEEGPN